MGSNSISSQIQTWDGRGCIYLRSPGTVFGSTGVFGSWIEILGLIGVENDVFFDFRLSQIFRISSYASSRYCYLKYLYIWAILWNNIHASLVSLCLTLLFIMLGTLTNPVLFFLLCISWSSSLWLNRLITERVYLHY